MAKKFSIEEAFAQLDEILGRLESSDVSLNESMDLYKKGVKLLDRCNQTLDQTEKEMIILQKGEDHDDKGQDS